MARPLGSVLAGLMDVDVCVKALIEAVYRPRPADIMNSNS